MTKTLYPGTRVRVSPTHYDWTAGKVGEVKGRFDDLLLVCFSESDSMARGHGGLSGGVKGPDGRCWYIKQENLIPLKSFGKDTQCGKLLRLMERGRSVTRLTALHYGIMNLTARISDLRNAGYDVRCQWRRDDDGNDYGSFSLV